MAPPQKKYVCGFCARAFTRSEHKQRHERSHTNEKPFHCLYCPSAFVRRDLLQRHCRTVHNIRLVLRLLMKDVEDKREAEVAPETPSPRDVTALAKALLQLVPAIEELRMAALSAADLGTTSSTDTGSHSNLESVRSGNLLISGASLGVEAFSEPPISATRILAVAKALSCFYDPADLRYPVSEMLVTGYWVLTNDPASGFQAKRFVEYFEKQNHGICDFQLGTAYTLLAAGALTLYADEYDREEVATIFMNKSWSVFVDRLMPKNTSIEHQSQVLSNLYLLTYTYLRFFNNSLIVPYLEDSASVIFHNLALQPPQVLGPVVRQNLHLFWRVYILVSKQKAKGPPPHFFSWFLSQPVSLSSAIPLSVLLRQFALQPQMIASPFLCDIFICTMSNELNTFLTTKKLAVFDLDVEMHSAILMLNKSVDKLVQASGDCDLFGLLKEKHLAEAPSNLKPLLDDCVLKLSAPYHWDLISLTLREMNSYFNFSLFMNENLHSSFQKFGYDLLRFFPSDFMSDSVQNTSSRFSQNLGFVSYTLLFNYNFLRLSHTPPSFSVAELDIIDLTNLNTLLLEWQSTMVKFLIGFVLRKPSCEEFLKSGDPFVQGLLYMLGDFDLDSLESFDRKFFLLVFNKLMKTCDLWLRIVNKTETMSTMRANLNRFLSDLFVLALNNDQLAVEDLYVTTESILFRNKRSRSFSSIDIGLSPQKKDSGFQTSSVTQTPVLVLPVLSNTNNNNYILMNKALQAQEQKVSWTCSSLSPTSSLPPLQMFPNGSARLGSPLVEGISSRTQLLPPLRSTVKGFSESNHAVME